MPRNGSGNFSLVSNSWSPALNGAPATAADWTALINDVAAAITQSLSRDGQTTVTGNLSMGNNKLTSLTAGTAAGDSLAWQQLFSQGQPANLASAASTDIGAQNTTVLNITGTTTITSFGPDYNGPRFLRFADVLTLTHNATTLILPTSANITTEANDCAIVVPSGTPANGWRVIAYQKADGRALVAPTAVAASTITGTLGVANGGTGQTTAANAFNALKQAASETVTGVVELATTAEATAGTDTTRAVTAAGLEAHMIGNALGWGQTWTNVSGSRVIGTTYTNSTGRPIQVTFTGGSNATYTATIGGVAVNVWTQSNSQASVCLVVPNGATYSISGGIIGSWAELR